MPNATIPRAHLNKPFCAIGALCLFLLGDFSFAQSTPSGKVYDCPCWNGGMVEGRRECVGFGGWE